VSRNTAYRRLAAVIVGLDVASLAADLRASRMANLLQTSRAA
jgi:hypothetical protein